MLSKFRSLLFYGTFYLSALLIFIVFLPAILVSRRLTQVALKLWSRAIFGGLKWAVGLTWEAKGLEHIPSEPCIFACKHQSAWETGIFYLLVKDPAFVLKKELLSIPLFGWYLKSSGAIPIDREAGAGAIKQLVKEARDRLENGQNIVIFPEGTRSSGMYHPGVAAIYNNVSAPVIPVALNSGVFWPRNGLEKRPGCVTIEFLPAMDKGLKRREFMSALQERIDEKSTDLVKHARLKGAGAGPSR